VISLLNDDGPKDQNLGKDAIWTGFMDKDCC
jgi:hypothetical protein